MYGGNLVRFWMDPWHDSTHLFVSHDPQTQYTLHGMIIPIVVNIKNHASQIIQNVVVDEIVRSLFC
jgi:hypothetical protein